MAQVIQMLFGSILAVIGLWGILPMLRMREAEITMYGILYLGMFLVGIDVLGKGIRK